MYQLKVIFVTFCAGIGFVMLIFTFSDCDVDEYVGNLNQSWRQVIYISAKPGEGLKGRGGLLFTVFYLNGAM
jgi:hypothetical protein